MTWNIYIFLYASSKTPYCSVCITKITSGGSAKESSQISLGDYIIAVDGQSTDDKTIRGKSLLYQITLSNIRFSKC